MYLIKPCPSCFRTLRFPIDQGKIRVKCICGESFIADPDDPALYAGAKFDLAAKKKKNNFSFALSLTKALDVSIKKIYDFRYRVQNLPLLAGTERYKTIVVLIAIGAILIATAYFICSGKTAAPKDAWSV